MHGSLSRHEHAYVDFSDPASLLAYAKKLEGHTFREVIELGITPEDTELDCTYNVTSFKGGMGTLIEERYFGYRANDNPAPDFEEAGVELKTTCFDLRKDGSKKAGERLVLSMIAYDETIELPLEDSHMWEKGSDILLIYYQRDRGIDRYDQRIEYVALFTPPEPDMPVIEEDYAVIQRYVEEGRADELSESLTRYLGACTKGATAEKSLRDQAVYAPGRPAKSRAWCYKTSYMNVVLNSYLIGDEGGESIIKDPRQLQGAGFDEAVLSLLEPFVGMTDRQICDEFGIPYTGNKLQWVTLTYRMLGIRSGRAEEFEKANISVRTVRVSADGNVRESMSLSPFRFAELANEEWEDAPLRSYFEETRFFFVAFQETPEGMVLKGARFWSMPTHDIEGPLRECWERTRELARTGVELQLRRNGRGGVTVYNNLPKASENHVAHVRPHTSQSAYLLEDGTSIGLIERDGDRLPDGQWMTRQSFWLNARYIRAIVESI